MPVSPLWRSRFAALIDWCSTSFLVFVAALVFRLCDSAFFESLNLKSASQSSIFTARLHKSLKKDSWQRKKWRKEEIAMELLISIFLRCHFGLDSSHGASDNQKKKGKCWASDFWLFASRSRKSWELETGVRSPCATYSSSLAAASDLWIKMYFNLSISLRIFISFRSLCFESWITTQCKWK